jgi:hypothetical protein
MAKRLSRVEFPKVDSPSAEGPMEDGNSLREDKKLKNALTIFSRALPFPFEP